MFSGIVFFFNDTAATDIYTLSLHDALPISLQSIRTETEDRYGRIPPSVERLFSYARLRRTAEELGIVSDRKSTRLNSSHSQISYAVFCLKKKKKTTLDS